MPIGVALTQAIRLVRPLAGVGLDLFTRAWGCDPADMTVIDGESHLGGLGIAEQVIRTLMDLGPRRASGPRTARR